MISHNITYKYMKSSFPKRDSQKWPYNSKAKSIEYTMENGFSRTYIYIYISIFTYVYIFMKSSFPKHDLQTWHWHFKLDFWIGAYHILEKRSLHIYMYIYIYLIIYMCVYVSLSHACFWIEKKGYVELYIYIHRNTINVNPTNSGRNKHSLPTPDSASGRSRN